MTEVQTKLIEDNLNLAKSEAWKFYRKVGQYVGMEIDDCISLGYLFLVQAMRSYDESKSKFSTYYTLCAKNWFMNQIRNQGKLDMYKFQKSLQDQVVENEMELMDIVPCEVDFDSKLILSELKSRLTQNEKIIVKMLYLGYSQVDISKKLKLSQASISRNIKKIKAKYNGDYVFDSEGYHEEVLKRDRKIIQLHHGGLSGAEIAKIMNLSKVWVYQIIKRKKAS